MHLGGRAKVLAIEIATSSYVYAWEPSSSLQYAEKVTLCPGLKYEDVPSWRKFIALLRYGRRCNAMLFGVGYNELYILLTALMLRITGVRVIMMTDSKFDDQPRRAWFEALKGLLLSVFHSAIVAGYRQKDYLTYLGFRARKVVLGYDCVSISRVQRVAAAQARPPLAWQDRPFICVGRMVPKKNHSLLLDAYAAYVAIQGAQSRRLVLVGNGPLHDELLRKIDDLGLTDHIELTGFLQEPDVLARMSEALALVLISVEEQWGLVVNEAVSLGLPVIVSDQVGARDLLVENLINGFVVQSDSVRAITRAMIEMASDEAAWHTKSAMSLAIAVRGDTAVFADAVVELTGY